MIGMVTLKTEITICSQPFTQIKFKYKVTDQTLQCWLKQAITVAIRSSWPSTMGTKFFIGVLNGISDRAHFLIINVN